MSFPKGPRFVTEKENEVPGPNTYNVQDPQPDAYKRGAFLEKTDRFLKDKPSEVPGPGAHTGDMATKGKLNGDAKRQTSEERYVALMRRLEDLERVHADDKKAHATEVDRLKSELSRAQKANTEHADRLQKAKKQEATFEARIQELKKASVSDQAELKDLRQKLRVSEHERAQLAGVQSDAGEAKKALQNMDLKQREELKERDRKMAELEKALASEKKKRAMLETSLSEAKGRNDDETKKAQEAASLLKLELDSAKRDAARARSELRQLQESVEGNEDDLLLQLENHRTLLARVADEYGRLANVTVAASKHVAAKNENVMLQLRLARLERKLANSEDQVVELALLIRQTNEQNSLLKRQLQDVTIDSDRLSGTFEGSSTFVTRQTFDNEALTLHEQANLHCQDILRAELELAATRSTQDASTADFYRIASADLLLQYSIMDRVLSRERDLADDTDLRLEDLQADRNKLASKVAEIDVTAAGMQEKINTAEQLAANLKAEKDAIEQDMSNLEAKVQQEVSRCKETVHKEKEKVQRLTAALQMGKTSEESLTAEIDQLTSELAEAERFQDAYYGLVEEAKGLVARNDLAEEEAQRLSKFNAEILGHHNPSQRIMYVDRIRMELAETKQKLLLLTRDSENMVAENEDLQNELDMYKSVHVPIGSKPRTGVTRVSRAPLGNHTLNVSAPAGAQQNSQGRSSLVKSKTRGVGEELAGMLPPLSDVGEMTVDELM
ncbi:hypothetical protein CONPUDRAFT_163890 [Coniophora puteana RWD-64-598 SS2]|uniref:Hyaluronan-mediated motility receptor C-terminal domain-containing protein n=1 Tax=Coniophora puteana (strain RWD-64-598) TaxID=741705 RepID=A0A5M3MUH0_CONPW|nr:uncharacterized protein CONPUDRAFT_163890 [Coniophora puteana RWD-64-598 SS2]EIW82822.1 hypothetical protein CONPUDRAFT_163890 [Coniophora puteana RWD-64-598 SS2]